MDFLHPESWSRAPGFSWGTSARGRHVFVAGQVGKDPGSSEPVLNGFGAQTAQAFANIVTVLAAGGAEPQHIAHMTWYVTDIDAYRAAGRDIGRAYRENFGKHFPSMTMLQVAGLLAPGAEVEIECIAVVPDAE